jgi:hypothetical protein
MCGSHYRRMQKYGDPHEARVGDDVRWVSTHTEAERAYLAGIIDGEGWIGVNVVEGRGRHAGHPPQHTIRVAVGNRDRGLIEWIAEHFGGNITRRKCYDDKWGEQWGWAVQSRRASSVLKEVLPYLVVKRTQAELAIQLQARKTGQPLTVSEWEARNSLRLQIVEANRKNRRFGPIREFPTPAIKCSPNGDHVAGV